MKSIVSSKEEIIQRKPARPVLEEKSVRKQKVSEQVKTRNQRHRPRAPRIHVQLLLLRWTFRRLFVHAKKAILGGKRRILQHVLFSVLLFFWVTKGWSRNRENSARSCRRNRKFPEYRGRQKGRKENGKWRIPMKPQIRSKSRCSRWVSHQFAPFFM